MKRKPTTTKPLPPPAKYKVGDVVYLANAWHGVPITITEDRGGLGVGGTRVYQIRLDLDPEPIISEMSEDRLLPAPPPRPAQAS